MDLEIANQFLAGEGRRDDDCRKSKCKRVLWLLFRDPSIRRPAMVVNDSPP
jgi:hypothetical protein